MGNKRRGWKRASASTYQIAFTYKGVECKERIPLQPSAANDKHIARYRARIVDAIAAGTFDYETNFPNSPKAKRFKREEQGEGHGTTVEFQLRRWLDRVKPEVADSTWYDWNNIVNNQLIPAFGAYTLTELRRSHVRDWCASLTVSNQRISNLLSPLRLALDEAVDLDEILETNPLRGWGYRRRRPPTPDHVDPLSAEEQRALLDALPAGSGRNLIQFAIWTGMRTSELVALQWADVSWTHRRVRVSRAKTQHSKEPETTKTAAGQRDIKLLKPAYAALRAQREHSQLHPSGYVWLNPRTGEPWSGDQAIRKTLWIPALRRAGVRYRNPYQTRHTYASMMLTAGEPPRWVATQMGHSDLHMLFRRYSRWIPDTDLGAGDRAVEAFDTSSTHGSQSLDL